MRRGVSRVAATGQSVSNRSLTTRLPVPSACEAAIVDTRPKLPPTTGASTHDVRWSADPSRPGFRPGHRWGGQMEGTAAVRGSIVGTGSGRSAPWLHARWEEVLGTSGT